MYPFFTHLFKYYDQVRSNIFLVEITVLQGLTWLHGPLKERKVNCSLCFIVLWKMV